MTDEAEEKQIAALASELKIAAQRNLILNFDEVDPVSWAPAIDQLVAEGDFAGARYAALQLTAARPDLIYPRNIVDILDSIPAGDAETLSFRDDLASDVQIVPRPGADTVMLVFGDWGHNAGMALSVAHRWFRRLPVSLVYLRDFRRLYFRDGLPGFGPGRDATLANLQGIIRSLGGRQIVCYGYSSGGFAAQHYGLDLAAKAVLALSPSCNLSPDFRIRPDFRSEAYRSHPISRQPIDLRGLYARAASPPKVMLIYGAGNMVDRAHAESMAGLRTVKLTPMERCDTHFILAELIRRKALEAVLRWPVEQ